MAYPDGFVEEVRRAADIVAYVSAHVSLRKMGTSWKGLCPFHQEKSPSFNVRQEPPVFHCFGCGEGGDVFKFAMRHERLSFPEAVETLARRFGVPLPANTADASAERKEREELLALLEAAADHFQKALWTPAGTKAREYLEGRGFERATLDRIRAGAACDSWSELGDALKGRFAPALLLSAGLVLERKDGKGHYDRFRNRAVFPILNDSGKVVAFGARSLDGSEPKYLNSPESPVYTKSKVLYGLSWAKDSIRRQGRAVLMEGYLDVARALQSGLTEAVASCGTALTGGQARLLRRFGERVAVNFDQDEAGQKAARKSLDVLLDEGLQVSVVELPEGHDPDTFLRDQGAEPYRKRLEEAPASLEWLIRLAAREHDTKTPAGKSAYLNALLPLLARIDSAVERAAWIPRLVQVGGLDERATVQEIRNAVSVRARTVTLRPVDPDAPQPARRRASRALLPAEKMLIALVLRGEAEAIRAVGDMEPGDITELAAGDVLVAARDLARSGREVTVASLTERLNEDDARLLTEIATVDTPTGEVGAAECVLALRRQPLAARLADIQRQVADASGDALTALLQEKLALTRQMASLEESAVTN